MVITAEQERVRTLIADTVSLLCKNGLHYTKEFSIEGLLGITLDKNDVFLVNIKEIVKSDLNDSDESGVSGSEEDAQSMSSRKRRRSKKSKKHVRAKADSDYSDNDTASSNVGHNDLDEPPAKRSIKEEKEDSGDDLVFVKDEPGSNNTGMPSYGQSSFNTSGANSDILGDMSSQGPLYATPTSNPLPGPSWDGSGLQQYQSTPMSAASQPGTPMSAGQMVGQQQGAQQIQEHWHIPQRESKSKSSSDKKVTFSCPLCNKTFVSKTGLRSHVDAHNGVFRYNCTVCGRGFHANSHLRGHMAQHTKVREFSCTWCHKEYAYSPDLSRHMGTCPMKPQAPPPPEPPEKDTCKK